MQRRTFIAQSAAYTSVFTLAAVPSVATAATPSAVITWNRALLAAIAATRTQATVAARAISMVHEAIYNAWVCYDAIAAYTLSGLAKRPSGERSSGAKSIAIAHAAYGVLKDLFPSQAAAFDAQLATTPAAGSVYGGSAAVVVGQQAATQQLLARRNDGANQYGDLAPGAYSDYTGYQSVNTPDQIVDIRRWQPLRLLDAAGNTVVQQFLTPQWGRVRPFGMTSGSDYRPGPAPGVPTMTEMNELIGFSAALDDTSKALIDFWAGNPGTVSPPGQWMQIAEQVSANDLNTLDTDVKLFFGAAQALLDASIAAWDAKRYYDTVRPITAIRYYFRNQTIRAWGGSGMGTQNILGQDWRPYQRTTAPTPPFPEYVSGHSTFSASAAFVLAGIRKSDGINLSGIVKANAIGVEGFTTPTRDIVFNWSSLPMAADSAGLSRRVGGIHFTRGDYAGRDLGRAAGGRVLARLRALFEGRTAY